MIISNKFSDNDSSCGKTFSKRAPSLCSGTNDTTQATNKLYTLYYWFIVGFRSYDQQPCFSLKTKENVFIIIEFNSWRISSGHQHSCHFVNNKVHQHGGHDIMLKPRILQVPVVQTMDSTIHWLIHYPVDKS